VTIGATRPELDAVFTQYSLTQYFTVIVTTENFTNSKPNPEPYLLTAQKLELPPAECVVIENTITGILSAKVAGMPCIALSNTYPADKLQKADYVAANYLEIISCIKQR